MYPVAGAKQERLNDQIAGSVKNELGADLLAQPGAYIDMYTMLHARPLVGPYTFASLWYFCCFLPCRIE